MKTMKEYLSATYYDNGNHILEFTADDRTIFVTVRDLGTMDDEFYWNDENNIIYAIMSAEPEDIEYVKH